MTEREFYECLKQRYGGNDYALIPQVRNTTGFARQIRTADAVAVSLFPSRGIDVHGFEFKDSRTDWLKELKAPAKSEEIGRFCAFWWLVVSDPKHFQADELPPAWGAMHATEGVTKILKKAPRRETQDPSWLFVAAVLRAAKDVVTSDVDIQRQVQAAVNKADEGRYARECKIRKEEQDRCRVELVDLQKKVQAFEAASGVTIDGWRWPREPQKVGEAVRFVLDGGVERMDADLRRIIETCDKVKRAAESALPPEKAKVAA